MAEQLEESHFLKFPELCVNTSTVWVLKFGLGEGKPEVLRLKIDLVSHSDRGGGVG